MNYLAHGYRFVDQPLLLAGTAVPDWLSVADRQVRMRTRVIQPLMSELSDDGREIARGILQHLQDDDLFHRCPRFLMLESELTRMFRGILPDPWDHRPPFLGHIVVELLLDAVIAERDPDVLESYYTAMTSVHSVMVQRTVNQLSVRPATRLAEFIGQFCRVRFLHDYLDDQQLLHRLNQVLRRVTLPPLDETGLAVLPKARELVRTHADDLLNWVVQPDQGLLQDAGSGQL